MQILPKKIQEMKDSDSTFFLTLVQLYLKTATLYFVLCDQDITFNKQDYTALPIEIGVVKKTVDNKVDETEITISNVDDMFSAAIFDGYDFRDSKIIILDIPYPAALTDVSQFRIRFAGLLDAPELDLGKATLKATVRSIMPSEFTPGRTFMLSCNNEFADGVSCFANKDLSVGTIQGGSDKQHIYIQQNQPDGYWRNGIITIGYETRKIKNSVGKRIDCEVGFIVQPKGSYSIERHCNKGYTNCAIFGQQKNYTGFLAVPSEYVMKG